MILVEWGFAAHGLFDLQDKKNGSPLGIRHKWLALL